MGKQNYSGDATKKLRDIKIGVTYFNSEVNVNSSGIIYVTDLERFLNTYNYVHNYPLGIRLFREKIYQILIGLINANEPIDEYFYTIGLHYLVTFDTVSISLINQPLTDQGFIIEPKPNDADGAEVIGTDYDTWTSLSISGDAA